eukprot:9143441-Pyramimonas_sp.AAC.1
MCAQTEYAKPDPESAAAISDVKDSYYEVSASLLYTFAFGPVRARCGGGEPCCVRRARHP